MTKEISHVFVVPRSRARDTFMPISTDTALFRDDCLSAQALDESIKRSDNPDNLTIVSAPCSYGAEADTLAIEYELRGYSGRLAIWGLDFTSWAIDEAQQGQYITAKRYKRFTDIELRALERYGLEVTGPIRPNGEMADEIPDELARYEISSKQIRERHDMRFLVHDIVEDPPPEGVEADLVVSNNFLHYLTPKNANRAVMNLSALLSANGVLSFGNHIGSKLRMENGSSATFYGDWLHEVRLLLGEKGLSPIANSSLGTPIMYAKTPT